MSEYEGMFAGATVVRVRYAKVGTTLPTGVGDHLPTDWKIHFPAPDPPWSVVVDLMQVDPALRYGDTVQRQHAAVVIDLAMPDGQPLRVVLADVELRPGEYGQRVRLMTGRPLPLAGRQ